MSKFIDITKQSYVCYGSNLTAKYPTKDRKYIKTLLNCLDFASMRDIYPNVKNPISHEVATLVRLGFLRKYTQLQFINHNVCYDFDTYSRVWYKITPKGRKLLKRVNAI